MKNEKLGIEMWWIASYQPSRRYPSEFTLKLIAQDYDTSVENIVDSTTFEVIIPVPVTSTLTVNAIDTNGDERSMWTVLYLDGNSIDTGFTPESYELTSGVEYKVSVANFESYIFDHWEDGSTIEPRTFSIITDTTFTAHYSHTQP